MDFDYNFFKIDYKKVKPEKGKVLIAEPFLNDTYFKRSMVLLTEHSDDGSVGFVLNKPVKIKLDELFPEMPSFETQVSIGGPVATNSIHYIHTLGDLIPNSVHVTQNIYWGGEFEVIKGMIETGKFNENQIRFFLGYSGWQPEQLDKELQENSWIVTSQMAAFIMKSDTSNLWKKGMQALGQKYQIWSGFPEDPGMN